MRTTTKMWKMKLRMTRWRMMMLRKMRTRFKMWKMKLRMMR